MLTLRILPDIFAIHRLPAGAIIPAAALTPAIFSITRTADELCLVLPANIDIASDKHSADWRALAVIGPLDPGLTGVLAGQKIPAFAISTFDTGLLLVRQPLLDDALKALTQAGYGIEAPSPTEFA